MTDSPTAEAGKTLNRAGVTGTADAAGIPQGRAASLRFAAEFAAAKQTTIRPIFESVGEKLRQRGHEIKITEEVEGKISIHIVPAGTKKSLHPYNWFPTLSFFEVPATKSIGLQGRNARRNAEGTAGTRGEFKPAQINPALVEQELLKFVGEIANW